MYFEHRIVFFFFLSFSLSGNLKCLMLSFITDTINSIHGSLKCYKFLVFRASYSK